MKPLDKVSLLLMLEKIRTRSSSEVYRHALKQAEDFIRAHMRESQRK
jgi:hypothetical protein